MAMVKCKECGSIISDKAKSCPVCGAPKKSYIGAAFCLVILVLIFLGVKSCIVDSVNKAENVGAANQYKKIEERATSLAPSKTPANLSAWKENPASPRDLNAHDLKESGKKVCDKAVSDKIASDFYEDCYKHILSSIDKIEMLNSQNLYDDYAKYIYPSCYYDGARGARTGDKKSVNANVFKACLDIQLSYIRWIKAYSDKFGEKEVSAIVRDYRRDFEERGSWFTAYKKLNDTFGPPPNN